jgi:hypothetical protein
LHVGDVDAEARGGVAVHLDLELGQLAGLEHAQVGDARHPRQHALNLLRLGLQQGQVLAEDLDRHLPKDARDVLLDVVLDGLREVVLDARRTSGKSRKTPAMRGTQRWPSLSEMPCGRVKVT